MAVSQTDIKLFRNYLSDNNVNTSDKLAMQKAVDGFKTNKSVYEFKDWLSTSYGKNALSYLGQNKSYLPVVANQFKYNQARQQNGLSALPFYDMGYDPNQYDDDTNEYFADFVKKNKRLPVANDPLFEQGLTEYKTKKHADEIYQNNYNAFKDELYQKAAQAQQAEQLAAMAEGRNPNEINWEDLISSTLTQNKYLDVAKNFRATDDETPTGYDLIADAVGDSKNKFGPQDLIGGYQNQGQVSYETLSQMPDFQEYAQKGATLENKEGGIFGLGRKINNKVAYANANRDKLAVAVGNQNNDAAKMLTYTYMTASEVDTHNYILAKYGQAAADRYLGTLEEALNKRMGGDVAENIKGNAAYTAIQSVGGGLDQAISGARQLTSKEALPVTWDQYASQETRKNINGDVGRAAFDIGNTVGNMLPSIGVSVLTGGVGAPAALSGALGSATLGATAGANTYAAALRQGYTPEQASAYGVLNGIMEGGLQYALGGISKLGGAAMKGVTGKIAGAIAKVVSNQTAAKILSGAAKTAVGMGGEFTEEYLQEVLDPVIRNITLNEKNEFKPFTEEALYSGILGAITGGLFEGADVASSTIPEIAQQARIDSQTRQFVSQVQSAGLDETASQEAITAYTEALSTGNVEGAIKLQTMVKTATAKMAELDANLTVTKTELRNTLQSSYDAMKSAVSKGDVEGFKTAQAKYISDMEITHAKMEAAKVKAKNTTTALRDRIADNIPILRVQANAAKMKAQQEGSVQDGGKQGNEQGSELSNVGNRPDTTGIPTGATVTQDVGTQPTGQASERGLRASGEGIQGGTQSVTWDAAHDDVSSAVLQNHIKTVTEATGKSPNVRTVTEIPAETADIFDQIISVAGNKTPNVYLYESDDDYGDGFTDATGIYIRTNGKANSAFVLAHEIAHNMPEIETAGMSIIENMPEELLAQYKAYRDANMSASDNADIKRELIADVFGGMMQETYSGARANSKLGLPRDVVLQFHNAFIDALSSPGSALTEDVNKAVSLAQDLERTAEYSRITFDDGYGNQLSYPMPEIKQKKDGTYHAEFNADGTTHKLENADKSVLEQEIKRIKEDAANKNASQAVLNVREATDLFKNRTAVYEYYEQGGTNHTVAKLLRAMYLRNGLSQGGALAETELTSTLQNLNSWKNRQQIWHTITSPIRLFEELGNWRDPKQKGARAMNFLEGEKLKNTYWGYIMDQGAQANLWMQDEAQKIISSFDGNQRTSTIAQMVGEGVISEQEAAGALYDNKNMVVRSRNATYVFNAKGELTAMSSGGELLIFDKDYRERVKQARAETAKLAANRDPKVSQEDHLKAIRKAEQDAMNKVKPAMTKGEIVIEASGSNVKATANGKVLADIQNGMAPDMEAVTKLKDALVDFYGRVLTQQNGTLAENGYKPIMARKEYFPHIGKESHGLQDFMDTIKGEAETLPTEISGITATFSPGKPFVNHMLQRMGNVTEFDAIRGFNKYVQASADLIFYTPAIQRIRQLEKFIREESAGNQNSALASWLHNYGNTLANKKPDLDRTLEDMAGRAVYTASDKLTRAVGAASVAGNVSSALSNMIGFMSSIPGIEQKQILPAIGETLRNGIGITKGQYDGFADKIPVLARRFNSYESILETKLDKAKMKGAKALGFMFQAMDRFSVEAAARAKYNEFKAKGLEETEAIRKTNDFIVKVFAERSKGMTAALFNVKSIKPIAQFQLEALNQMSHFRDLDRQNVAEQVDEIIQKNNGVVDGIDWAATENYIKAKTTKGLWRKIYYLMLMSLWGALTRALMGRDQTWNPVGMAMDITTADKPLEEAWSTLVDQTPFLSTFTGGRVPIAGGLDELGQAVSGIASGDQNAGLDLMRAMLSFVPGGAQAKKTIRGIEANSKGGYYSGDKLRYPVEESDWLRTAIFGPSAAAPQGYDWQKDALSSTRTEKYNVMVGKGIDPQVAYDFLRTMDKSGTTAGALVSLATYDTDKDGQPDLDPKEMNIVAEILGIKTRQNEAIKAQAKRKAEEYISKKRKEKDLEPEKLEEAEAQYNAWMKQLN